MTEAEALAKVETAYALELARGGSLHKMVERATLLAPLIKEVWIHGYASGHQEGLSSAAQKMTRALNGVADGT